jgi:C-terminal processing protease CtpA/Prc
VDNISDELKIYELSLIWKEAEYNFAFWDWLEGRLDWDKAYRDALPAVLRTRNIFEYYLELKKFAALLRDGHTGVSFPQSVTKSREYSSKLPINLQYIGGVFYISDVKRSAADKIRQWSAIRRIGGMDADAYIEKHIYPYIWHEKKDSAVYDVDWFLRNGAEGSEAEFGLEHDGQPYNVTLTRTKGDTDWVYGDAALKINEELSVVHESETHMISATKDGIAVIIIDTMGNNTLPKEFAANFGLLETMKGYVIDIRRNGGGNSNNSDAVTAAFIGGEYVNQRAYHPVHRGTHKAWGQAYRSHEVFTYKVNSAKYGYTRALTAPLAVLSSANTASAAEDLLIELDNAKRAVIVGSASNGSTGQPLLIKLESGGDFRVCTRHNTYPDGREFINIGVQPHIPHEMTVNDCINGVDSVLERGLAEVRRLKPRL